VKRALSTAVIAALSLAACSGSQRAAPRTRLSTKEILDQNKPGIVRIESIVGEGAKAQVGYGTGFVVGADGRIATNLHVIAFSETVKVRLLDGSEHPVTRVLAADPARDLAVIAIDKQDLAPLKLGDSDKVSAGDRVVAIGNPLGVLDYTVSDGLISSIRQLDPKVTLLQISAPISQGSSGGPLFNLYGEVIGVAVGIAQEGQNLNFGIPVNYLRPLTSGERRGEPLAAFAARMRAEATARVGVELRPTVPRHPLSVLDGCTPEQLIAITKAISDAISVGAPVYNRGEHEACFVIYRKVAETFEADQEICKGVRDAFGQGLLKAEAADNFTSKAWHMRDTFDGLLHVIERKVEAEANR